MQDFAREFKQTVKSSAQQMLAVPEAESEMRPASGQWSAKEILGHLIDSAANNHRRFVEVQLKDDLVFPGYDQERWVAVQRYQEASWERLIALWKAYNLHLAHVIASCPEEVLRRPREHHSLDRIAPQAVSPDSPASLELLIRDYYAHLQMHLGQLFLACGR